MDRMRSYPDDDDDDDFEMSVCRMYDNSVLVNRNVKKKDRRERGGKGAGR